jgi:hypothetical protein
MEQPYKNREIDLMFNEMHKRLDQQDATLDKILRQTVFTNGKVRKVIIALVLLAGFVLGISGQSALPALFKVL